MGSILFYQHCGSYLCGTNGRQGAAEQRMQSLLDMPYEMYLLVPEQEAREITQQFIYEAESMIVDGLLEGQRIERLEELWNKATAYERTHGYPYSLWYEYVPDWHKENMPEMPVR
jgi:hypothetical protein